METDPRNMISQKELNECDREPLHHIGALQGDSGHCLFFQYPSGRIVGHDEKIHFVKWIRPRELRSASTAKLLMSAQHITFAQETHTIHPRKHADSDTLDLSDVESTSSSVSCLGYDEEIENGAPDMIGTYIQAWIPFRLYSTIFEIVEGMKKALSQRSFHFYIHRGRSYALSISTTALDYSVIGVEIEEAENSNETADSFCSTLVHLGRIVEFYAHDTIAMTACGKIGSVWNMRLYILAVARLSRCFIINFERRHFQSHGPL